MFYLNNDDLLIAYYPLVLKIESKQGLPVKQLGILYTEYSIAKQLATAHSKALSDSLMFGALLLITAILIAVILHFRVSIRLNKLTNVSTRLAKGQMTVRANMQGQDELTQLGDAFDEMADTIQSNFSNLKEAENRLLELNNSLENRITERTELLEEAQRIAHLGNWQWHIQTGKLIWSDEIYKIFVVNKANVKLDLDFLMSLTHPDDADIVSKTIEQSLSTGKKYAVDHRIITQDNNIRWVHEEASITYDSDDNPEIMHGITLDITDYKKELEKSNTLEKQLQQSQKMESLGQLTGGIAHDFNNILASISGFTQLAQTLEVQDSSGKLSRYLNIVETSADKAAELISQMLAFSRTDDMPVKREYLSVSELIEETVALLRPIIPSSIELTVKVNQNLPDIFVNNVMFNQVLMNLCVNAKDAMEKGQGEINISAKESTITNGYCASCHNEFSGRFINITISDSGEGIAEKQLERLFEPFYTTKDVGKGTGMGLAMVHGSMHKNGGHIFVSSNIMEGTQFSLAFPVVDKIRKENSIESIPLVDDIGLYENKRILVVDDEISITLFMKDFLEGVGLHVDIINNSSEALVHFSKNSDRYDLVITDYTMPEMNGVQLAQAMMAIKSDLPIFLCSGFSEHINETEAKALMIKEYIEKPLNTSKLLVAIQRHT